MNERTNEHCFQALPQETESDVCHKPPCLWSHQYGYGAVLKCCHSCNEQKVGPVPILPLPTKNRSHSAHSLFLPTFDKLQRVSLYNFQGFDIQNWEESKQKMVKRCSG